MNKTWIKRSLAAACAVTLIVTSCGIQMKTKTITTKDVQDETTVLKENQEERYKQIEDKLSEIDDLLDKYYLNEDFQSTGKIPIGTGMYKIASIDNDNILLIFPHISHCLNN